jgi:hypothetical protein
MQAEGYTNSVPQSPQNFTGHLVILQDQIVTYITIFLKINDKLHVDLLKRN